MPNHIAIILDGNRRWAKRNLTIKEKGHFKGADAVENLLDWCEELDIKIITLYVLSADNPVLHFFYQDFLLIKHIM